MKAIEAEEAKINERLFQLKAERKPMENRTRARYERAEISDGSRPPNGPANPVADHGRRERSGGDVRFVLRPFRLRVRNGVTVYTISEAMGEVERLQQADEHWGQTAPL